MKSLVLVKEEEFIREYKLSDGQIIRLVLDEMEWADIIFYDWKGKQVGEFAAKTM